MVSEIKLYCVLVKEGRKWELSYSGRSMTPSVYDNIGSAKRQRILLVKNGHEVKIIECEMGKEIK